MGELIGGRAEQKLTEDWCFMLVATDDAPGPLEWLSRRRTTEALLMIGVYKEA